MMFRQIRYFHRIVEMGNFTEAAEACHISQSAISQQIKALENELDVQLLDRHNRTFSLTPAGKHFYERTKPLLEEFDQAVNETVAIARGNAASLKLGYLNGYGSDEFQKAVALFGRKYPKVHLDIMRGTHEELYDAMRRDEADLILNDQRRAFSDDYENLVLSQTPLAAVLPAHSPLADKAEVSLNQLTPLTCILVSPALQQNHEAAYYRDVIGIKSDFRFAADLSEAYMLVSAGAGYTLFDGIKSDHVRESVRIVPLVKHHKPIIRRYCAFWKTDNSGYYVEEFADMLKDQFE